jgi:3-hydroxybutyryl-CoA dehydrogenase
MTSNPQAKPLRVTVVGAGQMGQGIAQVCAVTGHAVSLVDANVESAARGKVAITERLERLVSRSRLTAENCQTALSSLQTLPLEEAAASADLIVEAITEDPSVKFALFSELDRLAPEHALLCSNTSSLSITKIAAVTRRPEQVVGVHFMNPVPLMPLVELVRGVQTSAATLEAAEAFARGLGKTTVVSKDLPGFIVNRLLIPLLNEACFALQEGVASVEAIDQAIHLGLNHPMGPLRLADLIGLDTVLAIAEVLHRELGEDKYRPAPLLRNLVAARHLGNKTRLGFYDYRNDGATATINPALL